MMLYSVWTLLSLFVVLMSIFPEKPFGSSYKAEMKDRTTRFASATLSVLD